MSISQQIEEVDRELALRRHVYPNQIAAGRMRESIGNFHIERMQAVRLTLQFLRDNEDTIKQRLSY